MQAILILLNLRSCSNMLRACSIQQKEKFNRQFIVAVDSGLCPKLCSDHSKTHEIISFQNSDLMHAQMKKFDSTDAKF